jgi:hypothetical protein
MGQFHQAHIFFPNGFRPLVGIIVTAVKYMRTFGVNWSIAFRHNSSFQSLSEKPRMEMRRPHGDASAYGFRLTVLCGDGQFVKDRFQRAHVAPEFAQRPGMFTRQSIDRRT